MRFLILLLTALLGCAPAPDHASQLVQDEAEFIPEKSQIPYLVVLGIAQDAGYPQAGCHKECCSGLWYDQSQREMVTCLGLVDPISGERWLFEASPDFKDQLVLLDEFTDCHPDIALPDGIFLTHAHIGHYTGLMNLGREAMGAKGVKVYAMPRMQEFLRSNGPWSQLVDLNNIELQKLDTAGFALNDRIFIKPFIVPHRDEFSETVGFKISGLEKTAVFIPDIDKWEKWELPVEKLVEQVDYALLDGTFYKKGEIPRDMSEVPHPFITESMERFESASKELRNKIHFIHFNHTNPVLNPESAETAEVKNNGFNVCREGMTFEL